jgi:hypothetical protein
MLRALSLSFGLVWAGAAASAQAPEKAVTPAKAPAVSKPAAQAPTTAPVKAETPKVSTKISSAKPATTAAAAGAAAPAATGAAKQPVKAAAKKPAKAKTIDDMAAEGEVSLTLAALTDWIITSKDNRKQPFAVVDKATAQILVFDAAGKLKGMTPVLIGSAMGDTSAEGIGDRELKDIPAEEKTTPAGRFLAAFGPAQGGQSVLWIDYSTSISIHPVLTTAAAKWEKRAQRLSSKTSEDNRITHGCINVSASFYANTVRPAFKKGGLFYILPDTISMLDAFPAYQPPVAVASVGSGEGAK